MPQRKAFFQLAIHFNSESFVGLRLTIAQSLMVAVLEQAVIDLQSPRYAVRRQAKAWFFARGARADHVFGFHSEPVGKRLIHQFVAPFPVLQAEGVRHVRG